MDKGRLKTFAETTGWYKLYIPSSELAVQSFADVKKQEGLLIELLLDYADAFYKSLKAAYEGQFYREKIVDEKKCFHARQLSVLHQQNRRRRRL